MADYTLPTASSTTLGGVKVGSGLAVTSDGTLSVTSAPTASACTGNAATASKATMDANGNIISTTYAKKTDVPDVSVTGNTISFGNVSIVVN